MAHFAVTAFGADRPGIVAAVTGVFVDLGCNLEDSSMTILRGHFAMMLVVDAPSGVDPAQLETGLAGPTATLDLVVAVRPIPELSPEHVAESEERSGWTVAVYGADRPGIVHGVTALLAAESVNIVDLDTRVIGEPGRPVYAMVLDVTLPAGADPGELSRRLGGVAAELGVEATLHPSEADIL